MNTTVVSEKGQITIPKALRDSLGIGAGTVLELDEQNGAIVARRRAAADPIAALLGRFPGPPADQGLDAMRGPGFTPGVDD